MDKKCDVIAIEDIPMFKAIEDATGLTVDNSNMLDAMEECKYRNQVYQMLEIKISCELKKEGKEPHPCFNIMCPSYESTNDRQNYCKKGHGCHGCLFQMLSSPPNNLNYNEYMPTHQEALDRLEKHGLLKGDRQGYLEDYARYQAAKTQDERWGHDLGGASLDQLNAAAIHILEEAEDACMFCSDNTSIIARNICIEMEKVLGIYPNICLS